MFSREKQLVYDVEYLEKEAQPQEVHRLLCCLGWDVADLVGAFLKFFQSIRQNREGRENRPQ